MIVREKSNYLLANKNNYLQDFPTLPILSPLSSYTFSKIDFLTKLQTRKLAFIKYQSNNALQIFIWYKDF